MTSVAVGPRSSARSSEVRFALEIESRSRGAAVNLRNACGLTQRRVLKTLEDGLPRVGLFVPSWTTSDAHEGDVLVVVNPS